MGYNRSKNTDTVSCDRRGNNRVKRRDFIAKSGAAGIAASMAGCFGNDDGETPEGFEPVPELHFVTFSQEANPTWFQLSRQIAGELEELGLEVNLDGQSFPAPFVQTSFEERDYDLHVVRWTGEPYRIDPEFAMNSLHHSSAGGPGGFNMSGFGNDEIDNLIEEQSSTADQSARQDIVYELQDKLVNEYHPATFIVSPDIVYGLNTARFSRPTKNAPGSHYAGRWALSTMEPESGVSTFYFPSLTNSHHRWNPLYITESPSWRQFRLVHDTLMIAGDDGSPENWVAETVDQIDDTTYEVAVIDGHEWHDGEPVTAEDIKFSYDWQYKNEAPQVVDYIDPVDEITVLDDQTVEFDLSRLYAPFESLTLGRVPLIPEHLWSDIENPEDEEPDPVIGSGPFIWTNTQRGTSMSLDVNSAHPHAPAFDHLRIVLYGDVSPVVSDVQSGDIDAASDIPTHMYGDFRDSDSAELISAKSHSVYVLSYNMRRGEPMDDPAFRKACAHAIPRQNIIDQTFDGRAKQCGSPISPAIDYWHNPNVNPLSTTADIEGAREILEDAGYQWNNDGRLLQATD